MRRRFLRAEELLVIVVGGLAVGVGGVLLVAGALDGVVFGTGAAWPGKGRVIRVVGDLLTHPMHPDAGYLGPARPSPSPAAYWSCVAVLVIALGIAALMIARAVIWSWRRRPGRQVRPRTGAQRTSPWATKKIVVNALSATAALSRDRGDGSVEPFRLGRSHGQGVYLAYEDSLIVAAPSRSGKTMSVVIPQILDSEGPVVALGTRADAIVATAATRGRKGRLWLWDPQGLGPDVGSGVRWPISDGCEHPETARGRAATLGFRATTGVENGSYWAERTISVLERLLHASALCGHDPAHLARWAGSAPAAREAVSILREAQGVAPGWAEALEGVIASDARHRDTVWSGVAEALKPLSLPSVARLASYDPTQGFSIDEFLSGPNTLYVIGTARGAASLRTVMAALIDAIAEAGRRRAAGVMSGRMVPPLSFILDEVAKLCPFPALPELLADGGGSGIATTVIVQALAQLETGWSRAEAVEMWANASAKVILGGAADDDDLEGLSKLVGEWEVEERSETSGDRGSATIHTSRRRERIAPPDFLRELAVGEGILLYRNLPPVRLALEQWHERKEGHQLRAHEATLRKMMVAARG